MTTIFICIQAKDGEDYKLDRNAELRFEVDARNEVQMEVCIYIYVVWILCILHTCVCLLALLSIV